MRIPSSSVLLALPVALLLTACTSGDTETPIGPPAPTMGAVQVTTTTSGAAISANRYLVRLGARSLPIALSGSVRIDEVPAGQQIVSLDSVPTNCNVQDGVTRTVPVTAGATGNVAFAVTCVQDFTGTTLQRIVCSDLVSPSSSALPLQELPIGRLPAVLQGPLVARMSTGQGSATSLGMVLEQPDGSSTLVVPLHPNGSVDGGEVTVHISDETRSCAPFTFSIAPLPAASGEFAAVVASLEARVAAQAVAMGTTVPALQQALVDTLPTRLLPLVVALSMVDHPRNPNSLRAIVNRSAADELVVLDHLLAQTGLRSMVALTAGAARVPAPLSRVAAVPTAAGEQAATCVGSTITTASSLSDCMNLAFSAALSMTGPTGKIVSDVGSISGLVGLVPHPGTRLAATAAGLLTFATQAVREGTANLLPSQLTLMQLTPTPARFNEDEEGPGTWRAEVTATSKGWKLDEITLNTIFQLAGARQGFLDWQERLTKEFDLAETMLSYVLNTVVQEAMNTTKGSGILEIAPETFGPVDVSDEQWTERVLSAGTSVALLSHTDFEPRAVGVSQLRVSTRPSQFGGQNISRTEPIEVGRLTLRFTRGAETLNALRVGANRSYMFQLRVEQSSHPDDVTFDPLPAGTGALSAVSLGGGVIEMRYTAPDSLTRLPISITARHSARTGARQFSTESRIASLSVLPLALRITPSSGCAEPGQTLSFSAELDGEVQRNVAWTASVGGISSSGVYTAPTGEPQGTAVVIGAKVANDDGAFADSVNVYVGPCTCFGTLSLGAPINRSWTGVAGWTLKPDGFSVGITSAGSAEQQLAHPERRMEFGATFTGTPGIGGFPLRTAILMGFLTPQSQIVGAVDPTASLNTGGGIVSVTAFTTGQFMQGSLNGSIMISTADIDQLVVPMQFTFRSLFGSRTQPGTPFFECYIDQLRE